MKSLLLRDRIKSAAFASSSHSVASRGLCFCFRSGYSSFFSSAESSSFVDANTAAKKKVFEKPPLPPSLLNCKHIIAVASGKGGVGEIDDRGKSRHRVREVWVKSRPARCGYFRAVDSVVDEFAQLATESGDGTRRIETDAPVGKFQRQVPIDGVFTPTRPSGGVERSHGHGGIE